MCQRAAFFGGTKKAHDKHYSLEKSDLFALIIDSLINNNNNNMSTLIEVKLKRFNAEEKVVLFVFLSLLARVARGQDQETR